MSVLNLTSENFDEAIADGRVLVDFWAAWCRPCHMLKPIIEELAQEYEGRVKVAKVDIDNEKELAKRFKILSIPTVVLFKDGVEVNRMHGVKDKGEYVAELEK
jgi:thioredoxin 1